MEENIEGTKISKTNRHFPTRKIFRGLTIALIAVTLGYIHYRYVSQLFENDRNFSFLSDLEREMSFRTEMGFYYSYYKTIVEERTFVIGIMKLMDDRLVEYPKEVNAFNRFNIHPEVVIGAIYRYFESVLNTTSHRECHMVIRGDNAPPVESCNGLGVPILFYLEVIWWLAGLTVAALFMFATTLSHSILGGLLAVAHYFANHSECTRVQWAPNERENLAAPLLLLQAWLVCIQLRDRERRTIELQVSIFFLNCLCLLFWQFTQFIFLTQTAVFFIMEQLRIIDLKALCIFLHSHFCGLHMAVLLLQGNDMLKSSLYTSFFAVVSTYCLFFSSLRIKVQNRLDLLAESWLVVLRTAIVICSSFYLKKIVSDFLEVQEDSHIWDILYSKFTNFKSFHTLLYTCSEVFDFLPLSSIKNMVKSFLIPIVLVNMGNVFYYWAANASRECREHSEKEIEEKSNTLEKDSNDETDDSGIENTESKLVSKETNLNVIDKKVKSKLNGEKDKLVCFLKHLRVDAAVFYSLSQMVVYAVMAGLVMRLKLLFTTQMCIVSSLMMNRNYYVLPKRLVKWLVPSFWLLCAVPLVREMYHNVTQQMSIMGEFSDLPQEQMLQWVARETPARAVFAGAMPVLAAVLLATRRAVVAHPHYEHQEARQRAYSVYKVYGKFTPLELYQELTKLRATYLIVESKYCYGRSGKGCTFEDIWDVETPSLKDRPKLCHVLLSQPVEHLYPVYRNEEYAVFRIHDYSVSYMPRSFDT